MMCLSEFRCFASQMHMVWVDRPFAGARVHCGGFVVPLFGLDFSWFFHGGWSCCPNRSLGFLLPFPAPLDFAFA